MRFNVPTSVGSNGIGCVWNQCYLVWFRLNNQFHEVRCWVSFNIEFRSNNFLQSRNICITNVTLIWSWMNCNSLRAEALNVLCCHNDIGSVSATCIADGSDFINVYAECGHVFKIGCAKLGNNRIEIHVVERKMNVRLTVVLKIHE